MVSPKQMRHVPASYLFADELAGCAAAATHELHRRMSFLLRCALLNAEGASVLPHPAQVSITGQARASAGTRVHTNRC